MSWDIYIQDLPPVPAVNDIPEDFRPSTLGPVELACARILAAVPFAERQDGDWFFVRTPEIDLSMQLNRVAGTDELSHIAVHVHGGARSATCVAAIVQALGLRALDTGSNTFFDPDAPEHGLTEWLKYRDALSRNR